MKNYLIIVSLIFTLSSCNGNAKEKLSLPMDYSESNATMESGNSQEKVESKGDTVHTIPTYTAVLKNAKEYYTKNKKYIDWDENDKRMVVISCVVEKDSTTSNIVIVRSSGKKELDNESIRLIKNAKIVPGKDDGGRDIRSLWTTIINFPGVL